MVLKLRYGMMTDTKVSFIASGVSSERFLNDPMPFGILENEVSAMPPVYETESNNLPKALLIDRPPVTLFKVKLVCIPKLEVSISHHTTR